MLLRQRLKRGKEDPDRMNERYGLTSVKRPAGRLVWFHAASIGESLSILTLIDRLLAARPEMHVLVTTGTVTSAHLMEKNLPEAALHQFVPLDHPTYCARFLDHWQPDLAVWVESEFWPNLIVSTYERGIPLALINARLTAKSFDGWKRAPRFIASLLHRFSLVLAQDGASAERLSELGAQRVIQDGNLKHDARALEADEQMLAALRQAIGARPLWLATNTHEGEEQMALEVHAAISDIHADLLTIIVPRHPARGDAIAMEARVAGLDVAQRSHEQAITPQTQIYIADTLGELGLFYSLACPVFIGGTFARMGGHNHFEAARFACPLIAGPVDFNFAESYHRFEQHGALRRVTSTGSLAEAVSALISDPVACKAMGETAKKLASVDSGAAERVLVNLLSLLPHTPREASPHA
ncbi:MAG: 3-deoxy-D-manno-octulosonic acid transferase [Rhizobiales bacterium]|nr:3-deoxy-D-manno-octulosonic acid transferase [Hyphomicrobiales bacterium]